MAFRQANLAGSSNIKSISDSSTSGTVNNTFVVPQDAAGVVIRLYTGATFSGTSPTADIYLQTTEDGGTTWRDVIHFNQITAAVSAQNAQWVSVPQLFISTPSITTAAASSLGAGKASGLPLLSQFNRISIVYGGTIGTNTAINVDVFCPAATWQA